MIEATASAAATVAATRYTRANPFPARLVVNRRLSGPESAKDTRHFELDLTGWGLSFEVGDSLAVYPSNDPQLVDDIVHTLGAIGGEQVPRPSALHCGRRQLRKSWSAAQRRLLILSCGTR